VSAWTPNLFLDLEGREPVYLQIARALAEEIRRGRFKPGETLPGYRTLAEQLRVSRNTVMAAYRELQAQGWLTVTQRSGTAVAARLPVHEGARAAAPGPEPDGIGFDLAAPPRAAGHAAGDLLKVATGNPDPRLLPSNALAQAYRRALTLNQGAALAVDDPRGHPRLRQAIAEMLARTRGIAASSERLIVTRGSQMALFLAAQALAHPGDVVAVEALGDRGAWEAFTHAGARCLPVAVDGGGMALDALEALLATTRLRAVLVTPRRHYPTLVPLAPARRRGLLELASRHRFAVLEADLDSEFQYEGRPVAPLAADDRADVVVHVGTLSKIFSPGLRLGFVHGPAPLVAEMRAARVVFDQQGDPVLERAMAELMEDGEVQRHLNRMHPVYLRRRDALCEALRRELGEAVRVEPPAGGLALWVNVAAGVDVDSWSTRAIEQGVSFRAGRSFAFDAGPVQGLRLGFANYEEARMREVARRMRAALPGRGGTG
jgi:GntR family transcriptional regulator/MocR family aminotransferase